MSNQCQHGQLARVCELCEKDAEIAQLRQYLDTAQRRASALGDEVAGLLEDAERYRWLRNGCCDKNSVATRIAINEYGMDWDSAIDAARKGEK